VVNLTYLMRLGGTTQPLVVLEPEQAALAALKILGIKDKRVEEKIREEQKRKKKEIEEADKEVKEVVYGSAICNGLAWKQVEI